VKIIRFEWERIPMYGILEGNSIFQIVGSITEEFKIDQKICKIDDVHILPPVKPRTMIGVGSNYYGLLKTIGMEVPKEPSLFLKASSCIIGHQEDITYPKISNDLRFEGELAIVIKRDAKHVSESKALDYVLGYTCANDLTIHDIMDRFPTRNKSFYTSCPLGPCIATGINGNNLNIKTRLNGKLIANDSTSDMIFSIEKIISYITGFMPLEPLDVILTGTSRGGGKLSDGDTVEVEIESIGILRNEVSKKA
jgi:2-keto-4-pentenoate hydratase/2-oxohepta-3-ene-1,7-dioic acid hydratase in catechol pathway